MDTIPDEAMDAFYEGKRSAELPLSVNDYVTVIRGRKPGCLAFATSIRAIAPEVRYLVEYADDGSDDIVSLAFLTRRDNPPA